MCNFAHLYYRKTWNYTNMKLHNFYISLLLLIISLPAMAQHREAIPFADFEHWVTRHIKESPILGGKERTLYAIAPDSVIDGAIAYRNIGGSPWATSNAYANVVGIKKVSCTVTPRREKTKDYVHVSNRNSRLYVYWE